MRKSGALSLLFGLALAGVSGCDWLSPSRHEGFSDDALLRENVTLRDENITWKGIAIAGGAAGLALGLVGGYFLGRRGREQNEARVYTPQRTLREPGDPSWPLLKRGDNRPN
jgi:hypothetical protein